MEIVYSAPPNYDEVAKAFDIKDNQGVVFTYGNKLYVPGGKRIIIDKPLMRHEETHAHQQKHMGVTEWWEKFLADPAFRLQQELEAYREQYRHMAALPLNERLSYLDHISKDLAGAMYGNLLTEAEAKDVITKGIILKHTKPGRPTPDDRRLKKQQRQNRKKGRK
jgi:hypothetical protein